MYVHKNWRNLMVMKKQTFVLEILNCVNIMYMSMEKFNSYEKINICIGDFQWCKYNVHVNASFIMVIRT
jgi:hypothetical protein